jgi:hypothetical protein
MTYAKYGSVTATDYNNRLTSVNNVWGTGSGSYGWGQSSISAVSTGTKVTAGPFEAPTEWAKLIQTLNNISTHEVGGAAGLTQPVTGNLVEWLSQLDTKLNQLCDTGATNNRFGNYTQFDDQPAIRGSYSQPWNETLGTTATVTFASANAARYFFNAGGRINISISYSGMGTAEFDIDGFVARNRGSYSTAVYKSQAEKILPYYMSNNQYTITSPTLASRWGLYRYPDEAGLAYWCNDTLANSINPLSQQFINMFFAAADSYPGSTRQLTPDKTFEGGGGTPQDNNWATLCTNSGTMWVQAMSSGGTSTNTNCGYYGSAGRMYSANGSGAYASNTLTVDVAGQGTAQLSFAINLADNHTNSWADRVTGTFTVTVLVRSPTTRGNLLNTWGTPIAVVPNFVASSVPAVPSPGGGGNPDAGGGLPSSITFYGVSQFGNNERGLDGDINEYWTVPAGVSSVSIIMISGGGGGGAATQSRNGQGGGGGGMLWINDIPVTPGDIFTIWKPWGGAPANSPEAGSGSIGGSAQITINNSSKGAIQCGPGVGGATGSNTFVDPTWGVTGRGAWYYEILGIPGYSSFGFQPGGNGGLGSPRANERGGGGGGAAGYTGAGGNGASWTTTQIAATAGAGGGGGGGAPTGTVGTAGYLPLGGSGGGVGYTGQGSSGAANGYGGSYNSGAGVGGLNGGLPGNEVNQGRNPYVLDPRDNTQFYSGGNFGGGGAGGVFLSAYPDPNYNPGWGMWGAPGLIRIIWGENRAYPNLNTGTP